MTKAIRARGAEAARPLTVREAAVRSLGDRLVEAQRPLRVLDAIKWDEGVERAFFATGGRELPPVTRAYYEARPLPFDPTRKRRELRAIECAILRRLGPTDPAGRILLRTCGEYRLVVDLLTRRGTLAFAALSERLYGGAGPAPGRPRADLGPLLLAALRALPAGDGAEHEPSLDAARTVAHLSARLGDYFGDPGLVRVKLADGLVADAAAGCDYIKVRGDARFSPREVRLLEVHEGWVHLGTTINGLRQPVCSFLARGAPSATSTQEGLAVLTELLAGASHPSRVRRLAQRIEAVALAEGGANFCDVYHFFLGHGLDPREGYRQTVRVFRGSLPDGCGPFTKDVCYGRGVLLVCAFLADALGRGRADLVPLLFCGKTSLADVPALAQLAGEGLLAAPRFLPPPFADPIVLADRLRAAGLYDETSRAAV